MFTDKQVTEIVDLLSGLDSSTKLYFGCDSVRYEKNGQSRARFATVFIVHMNGKNGCKIFSNISTEPDYDVKKNRPRMRMMNEVQKVCALYKQLIPHIEQFSELVEDKDGNIIVKEFDIEIHLDISQDPKNGSNCAASEAAGYVLGMTGIKPFLKPDAFASSFGGDWYANSKDQTVRKDNDTWRKPRKSKTPKLT